jgi:phosphoesterase RecJ-like protein
VNTVEEIANRLKTIKSAVIFTHMRPDGDTLGSGIALSRALTLLKIPNQVVNDGEIPPKFCFLEGAEEILKKPTIDAEAYICVDSSDEARLGYLADVYLAGAKKKITFNLDHHISNTRYAKYNYVKERSANCENIAEIISAMGVAYDRKIANALMTGLITDSGNFSHKDVNGDTFRAASAAADAGADVDLITYHTFRKQTRARAELYASVISRLRYFLDGRLAAAVIPLDELKRTGATAADTEGFVDFALGVDTVEVSASLLEVKGKQYKVSLRSKGKANVNEVAAFYGGGGHVLASGCMIFGELEEVLDKLRYTVSQQLGDR